MTYIQKEEKGSDKKDNLYTIMTISDELWNVFNKILSKEKPSKPVGRPVLQCTKVLNGILYILRTGCQWNLVPKEYSSDSTRHRRFQEWNNLDVFKKTWARRNKNPL